MTGEKLVTEIDENNVVNAKRFFIHFFRNDEITDLNIPPIKIPKTLQSVINVGYASEFDRDTDSSSSSESSDNSSPKEWSEVFAEDGRLRFDQILPLLVPSPELTVVEKAVYAQTLRCAKWALSSYNQENEGDEYELVAPLLSNSVLVMNPDHPYVYHANFFAKPKNVDSPLELFFAEVVACRPFLGKVLKCCILAPRLGGSSPRRICAGGEYYLFCKCGSFFLSNWLTVYLFVHPCSCYDDF